MHAGARGCDMGRQIGTAAPVWLGGGLP
jgi:hypothetical protein